MPDRTPPPPFHVFISAKSEDYPYAEKLFQFLQGKGIPTFFSQATLRRLGRADYRRAIDQALEQVQNLIVVVSRPEYTTSEWVQAEWGIFANELRSGRKHGNLITVTVGDLQPADLPITLRNLEVIPWDDQVFEVVLSYVRPPATPPELQPHHQQPTSSGKKRLYKGVAVFLGFLVLLSGIGGAFWWFQAPLVTVSPPQQTSPPPTAPPVTPTFKADPEQPPPLGSAQSHPAEPAPTRTPLPQAAEYQGASPALSQKPAAAPTPALEPAASLPEPPPSPAPQPPPVHRKPAAEAPTPKVSLYLDTSALLGKSGTARTEVYLQNLVQEMKNLLQGRGITVTLQPQPGVPTVKLLPPSNHQIFLSPFQDGDGKYIYPLALQVQVTPAAPVGAPPPILPIKASGRGVYKTDALELAVHQAASTIVTAIIPLLTKEN